MPRRSTKTETPAYSFTLKMNGLVYTAQGVSLIESIDKLGIDYTKVKTKGEVTVQKGDNTHTRIVQLPKLRRYFASKLLMSGLIRDLETLLK
jgi:hypothetical protein